VKNSVNRGEGDIGEGEVGFLQKKGARHHVTRPGEGKTPWFDQGHGSSDGKTGQEYKEAGLKIGGANVVFIAQGTETLPKRAGEVKDGGLPIKPGKREVRGKGGACGGEPCCNRVSRKKRDMTGKGGRSTTHRKLREKILCSHTRTLYSGWQRRRLDPFPREKGKKVDARA